MRGVSPVLRRGVAPIVLILLVAPMALAADSVPSDPPPPQARIGVPGGYTSQAEPPTVWDFFLVYLQARIGVPIG